MGIPSARDLEEIFKDRRTPFQKSRDRFIIGALGCWSVVTFIVGLVAEFHWVAGFFGH